MMFCLLLSLCACGRGEEASGHAPAAAPEPTPEVVETPAPASEAAPEVTAAPTPVWQTLYTDFLTSRFDELVQASKGAITGVGFIDLDLDGTPEMLLFDPGAGSAMGVQFFDIAEDQVVCVAASSDSFNYSFGGPYFSPRLYVNTTSFQAFRLREAADGQLYFEVDSYNGAEDFRYSERIRFTQQKGVLQLMTIACMQTSVDPETQEERYTVYTVGDVPIDAESYRTILARADQAVDLGYEAAGVFLWDDMRYNADLPGFTLMLEDALAAYVPAI